MEISHKMFRIRRSLPKIRSDPARLPRPLQGLAMTSATFSTSKRINEMYRPASRTVSLSKSPFGSFAKLPSKLQNVFCSSVLQFCRCGGLFDAKGHPDGFLSACRKVPSGFLPSCFQNCKMKFCSIILQFCRCGGLLNAKGNPDGFLSHFSSLRNLRLGRFFDSLGRLCGCTVSPQFIQPASRVTAMPASTLKP